MTYFILIDTLWNDIIISCLCTSQQILKIEIRQNIVSDYSKIYVEISNGKLSGKRAFWKNQHSCKALGLEKTFLLKREAGEKVIKSIQEDLKLFCAVHNVPDQVACNVFLHSFIHTFPLNKWKRSATSGTDTCATSCTSHIWYFEVR